MRSMKKTDGMTASQPSYTGEAISERADPAVIDPTIEQTARRWLVRRASGAWRAADSRALADWLASDSRHEAAWRRGLQCWTQLAGLHPLAEAELQLARQATCRRSSFRRWGVPAMAGVAALALCLLSLLLPGSLSPSQHEQTARGEQRRVLLADGSSVELNTGSRIEIDYGLTCRCLRLLAGEAVFNVVHGDPRSFEVKVDQGRIRDIGTTFWIRRDAARVGVGVLLGEIEVQPFADQHAAIRMQAGEHLSFDGQGELSRESGMSVDDLTAWRQGKLVFHDRPLPEVLGEFARYRTLSVEVDSRLKAYRLSGSFSSDDLDGLLQLIQSAYPVSVERPSSAKLRVQLKRSPGNSQGRR